MAIRACGVVRMYAQDRLDNTNCFLAYTDTGKTNTTKTLYNNVDVHL